MRKLPVSDGGRTNRTFSDPGTLFPPVWREWKHQMRTYMIHGHIHNDTRCDFWLLIRSRERVLNAGVDIKGFEPVSIEELIENNNSFKASH